MQNLDQWVNQNEDMTTKTINKFECIKKGHTKTINGYSFFIDPLLKVVYPTFLRKKFNQEIYLYGIS